MFAPAEHALEERFSGGKVRSKQIKSNDVAIHVRDQRSIDR